MYEKDKFEVQILCVGIPQMLQQNLKYRTVPYSRNKMILLHSIKRYFVSKLFPLLSFYTCNLSKYSLSLSLQFEVIFLLPNYQIPIFAIINKFLHFLDKIIRNDQPIDGIL